MAGRSFVLMLTFCLMTAVNCMKLEQVLILSRHNIRTPLTARLENTTPHAWPKWNYEVGHLTEKGALLERYMGEHVAGWLSGGGGRSGGRGGGLWARGCPPAGEVLVYANTKQRTRRSADAFIRGAFKNCNISTYSINSDEMDPVFNPILRDTSEEAKQKITKEMLQKLEELQLDDAYVELNDILDLGQSDICKNDLFCDFLKGKNEIVYTIGEEPNVVGPLAIANSVMDAFIMSYYEGMPDEDVAWGRIQTPEQWSLLSKIIKENQNVRFNSSALARDVARPLLQYIREVFAADPPRRLTALFGHDSNLNSVMAALGFKYYELPEQYEATPPGGKIVFQKWFDEQSNRRFMKINYVYQSTDQIRSASRVPSAGPPLWARLELRSCAADADGYCPWEAFLKILDDLQL